jgi:hypothetical protein
MGGPWLVMADVDGVQSWLLRSVHLREIAGASQLLVEHDENVHRLAGKGEVLFSGGGTALIRFDDIDEAGAFGTRVPEALRQVTVNATLTVSEPVPVEVGGFGEAVTRAVRDLEQRKRQGHALGELVDFCHALRCEGCGLEPVSAGGIFTIGDDLRRLGKGCLARHQRRDRPGWLERMRSHEGWQSVGRAQLPADAAEMAGNGKLAIVLADVNGVGDRLAALRTEEAYRNFSRGLAAAVWDSLTEAIAGEIPPARWNGGKLPVEVLYVGGDDLLIACRADLALSFVTKLVTEFASHAGKDRDWVGGEALGISASIAIVNPKFPFRTAHALGAGLLRHAKRAARTEGWIEGALDWAVVTEAWAEADAILADRVVETSRSSLHFTGRPYRACEQGLRSIGSFRKACREISLDFPRNKLFEFRQRSSAGHFRRTGSRAATDAQVQEARATFEAEIQRIVKRIGRNPEVGARWERACELLELRSGFWEEDQSWRSPVGELAEGIELWGIE